MTARHRTTAASNGGEADVVTSTQHRDRIVAGDNIERTVAQCRAAARLAHNF
jgi:gamma-glutamyl:cysteine ligase YbdK (ATP-grasp superfamily)